MTRRNAGLALEQALAPFGGLDWVKDGMRVVIKVNLVSAMKPEQAATTHPALLCELTKMLRARGASVLLGDSPGGLYTAAHVNHVYDLSGMHACEAVGAELNQDFSQADASFPDAVCAKKFTYTAYLDQADAIIDFCKLKTHGMMGLTNAVKNYFGVIPGTMKPEYHYKYPQISDFSNMLIDLSTYFKPRICICDAVVGMEGNGPTQGSPRAIGAVLAAESASKLDLLAAKLIGLTADDVPTLQAARMRGLIPQTAEELIIAGEPAAFIVPDFKTMPAQSSVFFHKAGTGFIGKIVDSVMFHALTPCPKVQKKRLHRLRQVRKDLSGKGNFDAKQAPRHRPQGVHPLLLLPGVLPEGRNGRLAPRHCAAAQQVKHSMQSAGIVAKRLRFSGNSCIIEGAQNAQV